MNRKYAAFGFIVLLIAIAVALCVYRKGGKSGMSSANSGQGQETVELVSGLEAAAEQINQQAPVMVDRETRMDGASVGPGCSITYHYTLPNYSSDDIAAKNLLDKMRPEVKSRVCSSREMKASLQHGARFIYSYSGKNSVEIARFEINGNDCGFLCPQQ